MNQLNLPTESAEHKESISLKLTLLLLLFTFLMFANTIDRYFLLDDFDVLYSVKFNKLSHALLGYDTVLEHRFFRPIPMFSYWLQHRLFGLRPAVFHITTLLLHAASAALAANLFYILFRNSRAAAILGFVFVAFPNHCEVVNWPAINYTSWASVFYLASLNLFGYYRLSARTRMLALSLVSFLAALLSKELAFTLPVSLLLFDFFFSRSRGITVSLKRRAAEHSLYWAFLLLVLFSTRTFLHTGYGYLTPGGEDIVSLYLGNVFVLVSDLSRMYLQAWRYLLAPLSPDIPFEKALTLLILVALTTATIFLALRRRLDIRALAYCFLFVSITLLPVLGTFRVLRLTHWIRFLYLPSAASSYMICMVLDGIAGGMRRPAARYIFLGLVLIPILWLAKVYDNEWIEGQKENKRVIDAIVRECPELPQRSRIYVSGIPWAKNEVTRISYGLPSAIALYCDRDHVEAALNFLPAHKIISLERERYTENNWRYLWFEWDDETGTLNGAGSIQPQEEGHRLARTWDFSRAITQTYLQPASNIGSVNAPGFAYPLFIVEGGWAFLKLPALDSGPPIKYLILEMMLKAERTKRDVTRVFWVTEDDLDYGGDKSIGFHTMTDGEFREYRIPLYRNGLALIDPHIVRFAIRPSQNIGTVFSIRKMSIEYY